MSFNGHGRAVRADDGDHLALLALTHPDDYERTDMLRAAIIPLLIGVTVLAYTYLGRPKLPPSP